MNSFIRVEETLLPFEVGRVGGEPAVPPAPLGALRPGTSDLAGWCLPAFRALHSADFTLLKFCFPTRAVG